MAKRLNTTLKTKDEINRYVDMGKAEGFKYRTDHSKNWDNYKALAHVLEHHPKRDTIILDAGGIVSSAFLPSLQMKGYTRLVALDFANPSPPKVYDSIVYARGDLTQTSYPNDYFDVVASLSVIEHGVDIEKLFTEMERIIRPGGSLIVSTDYWKDKVVNPDGRQAYGVPVHIFSGDEVLALVEVAKKHSFELVDDELDLECGDRTIQWMGFNYTFIILGFRKVAP